MPVANSNYSVTYISIITKSNQKQATYLAIAHAKIWQRLDTVAGSYLAIQLSTPTEITYKL